MRIRRLTTAVVVGALGILLFSAPLATSTDARLAPESVARTLASAYPQVKADGANVVFADGTKMAVEDGKSPETFEATLDAGDLVDQLSIPYPIGCPIKTPTTNEDPGRIRFDPFFAKIYGGTPAAVAKQLTSVKWFGSSIQVTTVNGVDTKLAAVARELAKHPEWKKYLVKPGGGFNWRPIAGTSRRSVHSYGIAVDINVGLSDYWRNGGGYRNRIPCEIGAIFESQGFIWGAKWAHFDTMHFEYRPELLGSR